jgi:phage-related tail protein
MKNYIRTNMIKIAVFTESFQDKFAKIGALLAKTLNEGVAYQIMDMSKIRSELNELYDSAVAKAKFADSIINSAFGDIGQTVEETTEQIEESVEVVERTLTRFEELMEGFKDEVADVGGEIGSSFVDAISEGMNQGDFLQKMKGWIKKMLVQSVVYTESMKSEIEAIGQAITNGIREGFTETSLHEIRRDLSWVFNEANKTVSSLDDILDKTFGGYAVGTNNALSGLHLVGEAGPELVKFRGGEQVLNANNTQKALSGIGGTTINQNVTFNNLQDTTAYAMMNQFKQYNRSLAINGVI